MAEVIEPDRWEFSSLQDLAEVALDDVVSVKRLTVRLAEYQVQVHVPVA